MSSTNEESETSGSDVSASEATIALKNLLGIGAASKGNSKGKSDEPQKRQLQGKNDLHEAAATLKNIIGIKAVDDPKIIVPCGKSNKIPSVEKQMHESRTSMSNPQECAKIESQLKSARQEADFWVSETLRASQEANRLRSQLKQLPPNSVDTKENTFTIVQNKKVTVQKEPSVQKQKMNSSSDQKQKMNSSASQTLETKKSKILPKTKNNKQNGKALNSKSNRNIVKKGSNKKQRKTKRKLNRKKKLKNLQSETFDTENKNIFYHLNTFKNCKCIVVFLAIIFGNIIFFINYDFGMELKLGLGFGMELKLDSTLVKTFKIPTESNGIFFEYSSDFDTSGVMWYLGTLAGKRSWYNPADPEDPDRSVLIRRSTDRYGHSHTAASRDGNNVAYTDSSVHSGAWVSFDFGRGRRLLPSQYTLRCLSSRTSRQGGELRRWLLEGSNDNVHWTLLRRHGPPEILSSSSLSQLPLYLGEVIEHIFNIFRSFIIKLSDVVSNTNSGELSLRRCCSWLFGDESIVGAESSSWAIPLVQIRVNSFNSGEYIRSNQDLGFKVFRYFRIRQSGKNHKGLEETSTATLSSLERRSMLFLNGFEIYGYLVEDSDAEETYR